MDSDEELCRRVAQRDHAAFELLVQRHRDKAYRLAWSVLRDAEEARDLSQEAFLRVYEAAGSFDGRSRFSTWLYRIVVNLCLDHRRRGKWWRTMFNRPESTSGDDAAPELRHLASPEPGPEDQTASAERKRALSAAIAGLSANQRVALTLWIEQDLPAKQIGGVLGCSEATARVHLHRALTELKKTLKRN